MNYGLICSQVTSLASNRTSLDMNQTQTKHQRNATRAHILQSIPRFCRWARAWRSTNIHMLPQSVIKTTLKVAQKLKTWKSRTGHQLGTLIKNKVSRASHVPLTYLCNLLDVWIRGHGRVRKCKFQAVFKLDRRRCCPVTSPASNLAAWRTELCVIICRRPLIFIIPPTCENMRKTFRAAGAPSMLCAGTTMVEEASAAHTSKRANTQRHPLEGTGD